MLPTPKLVAPAVQPVAPTIEPVPIIPDRFFSPAIRSTSVFNRRESFLTVRIDQDTGKEVAVEGFRLDPDTIYSDPTWRDILSKNVGDGQYRLYRLLGETRRLILEYRVQDYELLGDPRRIDPSEQELREVDETPAAGESRETTGETGDRAVSIEAGSASLDRPPGGEPGVVQASLEGEWVAVNPAERGSAAASHWRSRRGPGMEGGAWFLYSGGQGGRSTPLR
jgi:hypothetical protein